jgi:hypothetical protein
LLPDDYALSGSLLHYHPINAYNFYNHEKQYHHQLPGFAAPERMW